MIAFERAADIADAVLYEGYLLYPYTASATKNHMRWQFGVLVPPAYAQRGTGESDELVAQICARADTADAQVECRVRFLQIQARIVESFDDATGVFTPVAGLQVEGEDYITWDEAVKREVAARVDLSRSAATCAFAFPASEIATKLFDAGGHLRGRVVRRNWAVRGGIELALERSTDAYVKLQVRVTNESAVVPGAQRNDALRTSLISTHALLAIEGGAFVSHLDPPGDAADLVRGCEQRGVFPVLVGDAVEGQTSPVAFASPIVLYDFPKIAPQSRGNLFDGTEIDELLNLSVLSLSDAERREARATDPAAREIVDRAESLLASDYDDMHGTVTIDGVVIARGSRVRLHPKRRADVWDDFIDGKDAHVQAVYRDMEDETYVAVTVDDDPASEFHEWYGRALFFKPDEVEPLREDAR